MVEEKSSPAISLDGEKDHQIKVIGWSIDWPNDDDSGLIYRRKFMKTFQKSKKILILN